jgi:DNA gyrase/topoisomerase IV subunit A
VREEQLEAMRMRLRIVEGLLRALSDWDRVSEAVRSTSDETEAVDVLCSPPLDYEPEIVSHILHTPLVRLAAAEQHELRRAADELRARLTEDVPDSAP